MKLKYIAPLSLFMSMSNLFAQNNFQGIVADLDTKEPLAFVNIGVVNKNIGTVSDPDGFFSLSLNESIKEENIRFSMIGYKNLTQSISSFANEYKTGDTILLKPEVFTLSEIVLSDRKWTHKTLGNKTKSKSISAGFTNNELGNEIGVIISIKESPTVLERLKFHINENQYDPLIFRVNIYSLKNGFPDKSLVYENIIVSTSKRSGHMKIDLTKYNIWVEGDFYIGLEWIQDLGNKSLLFSADLFNEPVISRQTSQGDWNHVKGLGLGFNVDVKH